MKKVVWTWLYKQALQPRGQRKQRDRSVLQMCLIWPTLFLRWSESQIQINNNKNLESSQENPAFRFLLKNLLIFSSRSSDTGPQVSLDLEGKCQLKNPRSYSLQVEWGNSSLPQSPLLPNTLLPACFTPLSYIPNFPRILHLQLRYRI